MAKQSDSGLSLKDDIASIWTDPTYHDVAIICADGVELSACRAILASRCPVFKAMLYGNMQESISQRVVLHDITSAVLNIVLGFIHTENIGDSIDISLAVDIYRAANFLLLPKLMAMVLVRVHNINDFGLASSLLNCAVATIPPSESSKELYSALLKPFRTRKLALGKLSELSKEALELFLSAHDMINPATPEHDLLLCIVDWVWARSEDAPPASERCGILRDIDDMVMGCEAKIQLGDGSSRALLLNMLNYIDLTLVCPHRLKIFVEAVDAFAETSPHYMAFCHHACKNTVCPPGHPSGCRGAQWDRSKIGSEIVVSEDGKVVEFSAEVSPIIQQTARILAPGWESHDGLFEWDIVVESIGSYGTDGVCVIGLIGEEFEDFDNWLSRPPAWMFCSYGDTYGVFEDGNTDGLEYGTRIKSGDVITLHLNRNTGTCSFSINGTNYGTAWTDLPSEVHPAVTLRSHNKYRIKDRSAQ